MPYQVNFFIQCCFFQEQEVMQTKTETETEKDIEILETEKVCHAGKCY